LTCGTDEENNFLTFYTYSLGKAWGGRLRNKDEDIMEYLKYAGVGRD
jgi:hypothetical protein